MKKITFLILSLIHIQFVFGQWKQVQIPQSSSFYGIKGGIYFSKDSLVVYDLGSNYLSTDGGNTFVNWDIRPIGDPISLQKIAPNKLRSISLGGRFINTSSTNGNSWAPMYIKNATDTAFKSGRILMGHFFDEDRAIAIGDIKNGCYEIWNTTDGGENWSLIPCKDIALPNYGNSPFLSFQKLYSYDGTAIFMNTSSENKNKLIRTTNYGLNFDTILLPQGKRLQSIAFLSANQGLAIMFDSVNTGNPGTYYQVTNKGQTFTLYENKKLLDAPIGVISHTKNDGKVIYLLYGLDGFFYSNSSASDWFFMDAEKHQQLFSFDDAHIASIMIPEQGNPNRLKIFESILLNTNHQINQLPALNIFPNPAKNLIQISEPITHYSISSIEGKVLQTNISGLPINTISITSLNPGTYILTMNRGDKTSVHRIQIEN